jgi:signal transduction histidine kinase
MFAATRSDNRRRTILALAIGWILFWALMIAVAIQDYLRSGRTRIWEPLLWEGSSALVITVLGLAYRRLARKNDRLLHTPARWFLAQSIWLPVIGISFIVVVYALRHGVYALAGVEYRHEPWGEVVAYEAVKLILYFGLFMAVLFGILSYRELTAEKERAQRSAALLRQAQLQSLTQQVQPHFLFNALNTISSLMHVDAARADMLLARLSDLLRATLDMSGRLEHDVRSELDLLRAYAELMAERFADRVDISWTVDDAALDCRIPVMSLQPLLENTFKHTVERRSKPTRIVVSARREGEQLRLSIEDDAGTLTLPASSGEVARTGVGTKNLRERLATLYGDRAEFRLIQLEPAGVRAEMRVPCAY